MSGFHRNVATFVVIAALLLAGCEERSKTTQSESKVVAATKQRPLLFVDVANDLGVSLTPRTGQESGRFTILESLGSGVAATDFDRDGRVDIIAPGGGYFDESGNPVGCACGVFRNASSTFQSVGDLAGINTLGFYSHGVATGDWNNDGFDDIAITGYRNVLMLLNLGDGTFQVQSEALIDVAADWATSAAFCDLENDGLLDLYVVHYVHWQPDESRRCYIRGVRNVCAPGEFEAADDTLWHNLGDGTFADVSRERGLQPGGKGLAVAAGDIDLDGDTDVYVANDTTQNFLYINDGTGMLSEQGLSSGTGLGATAEAEGSMGIELADFNRDGLIDIWVSNYENQSFAMYQGKGARVFQHVSAQTGITAVGQLYVGFGTVAIDADLDGDEDIFAANGHVMYEKGNKPAVQQPLLFQNQNGQRFQNVAVKSGVYMSSLHMGRGVAGCDFDSDGRPDLVVSHSNEPIAILHNQTAPASDWATLSLVGTHSNRSAIGAIVSAPKLETVKLSVGGGSYLSANSRKLHFAISKVVDSVEVRILWPSGQMTLETLRKKQHHTIVEPLVSPTIEH